jgi:hypothetical protein
VGLCAGFCLHRLVFVVGHYISKFCLSAGGTKECARQCHQKGKALKEGEAGRGRHTMVVSGRVAGVWVHGKDLSGEEQWGGKCGRKQSTWKQGRWRTAWCGVGHDWTDVGVEAVPHTGQHGIGAFSQARGMGAQTSRGCSGKKCAPKGSPTQWKRQSTANRLTKADEHRKSR